MGIGTAGHPLSTRRPSGRELLVGVALGLGLIAAACGRSGFQYIENNDDTVFVKIPEEWEVVSEGIVDFSLTSPDGDLELLPGDSALPWRAVFDATPGRSRGSLDHPSGWVEVQPVDRRMRSDITDTSFFEFDPTAPDDGFEVLRQDRVTIGDFSGRRIVFKPAAPGGSETTIDRLVLTDDRNSVVYYLSLACSSECYEQNASVIEEIMTTFRVVG